MAQKPKLPSDLPSPEPSSTVVFARFGRPKLPHATLPLPSATVTPTLVETPPALDLSGKRKVLFFIGRGRIGKTTLVRWMAEVMDEKGATAIVAAADPTNRTLRIFRDNIAEPDSEDPDEVRDWLRDLLQHVMDNKLNAMIDLGGGKHLAVRFVALHAGSCRCAVQAWYRAGCYPCYRRRSTRPGAAGDDGGGGI